MCQTRTIYGLVRTSTNRQDQSIQVQSDLIRTAAAELEGRWGRLFIDEDTSATKIPFMARPAVREMMLTVRRGDCVIIWKFDRIARRMRDVCDLIEWVNREGIQLYVLNIGQQAVDFSTVVGKVVAYAMTMAAELEAALIAERIREAMAWRRQRGLPTNGACPIGHKRIVNRCGKTVGHLPSPKEKRHMAEAYVRVCAGESLYSIGRDFRARNMTTADGKHYIRVSRTSRGANVSRLKAGIEWYRKRMEELRGDPTTDDENRVGGQANRRAGGGGDGDDEDKGATSEATMAP